MRRLAYLFLSAFIPSAVIAAFWVIRLPDEFSWSWNVIAIASFLFGIFSALKVLETQKWMHGLCVEGMLGLPEKNCSDFIRCKMEIVRMHSQQYLENERQLKRIDRWSTFMVAGFLLSAIFLGASYHFAG